MQCVLSRKAEDDLEVIADYIACDNPRRALTYIAEIRERCHTIISFPEAAPLREEFGIEVRMIPFGRIHVHLHGSGAFFQNGEAPCPVERSRPYPMTPEIKRAVRQAPP